MFVKKNNRNLILVVIFVGFLALGIFFAKIYQPESKTNRIYIQALKDYENKNYSNSYYLFSKISYSSKLKPVAIYRQALCARALGDEKSEIKKYQTLFHFYPNNKLSNEAKYQAAQLLVDSDPKLAKKYFNSVAMSNAEEDYKLASEYYKARIASANIRYSNKIFSRAKMAGVEHSFRKYLEKAPRGRLSVNVAYTWKKFNPNLKSRDLTLISRAYYYAGKYKEAEQVFPKTKMEDSWTIQALTAYAKGNYIKTQVLTEYGVNKHSKNIDKKDFKKVVDNYIKLDKNSYKTASLLFSKSKGEGKDYIWSLKCQYSPKKDKASCYNGLYANYPSGDYAETAMSNLFFDSVEKRDYVKARQIGEDFLHRFPNSETAPMVMFWEGKIDRKYSNSSKYVKYFQDIINKYPDTYYAYRAFWILKGVNTAVIPANLEIKPVVYPYRFPPKNSILYSLIEVQDYNMLTKFTKDDFIKSWAEYQRGNYSTSMLLARDAMAKLEIKPVKSDLRWRLVYPLNYYRQVKSMADEYKNNDALMMSIIREESYFNSESQSGVGAIGLMQLMPATAHEVGNKNDIQFNTNDLLNPELNIRVGNLYYSILRSLLENKDISAIAAYNGGVGSVTSWKTTLKYQDTDEFVEQIPYPETKNYVKKVFRSYWNYTRIYQK